MPKFRTKKKDRATYIYRDAYGKEVDELRPGKDNVAKYFIDLLHSEDDAEKNSANRDSYHGLLHYDQSINENDESPNDWKQQDLADLSADPESMLIRAKEEIERSGAFKTAWNSLTDKQRDLVMKKLQKRSNVNIAKEEHITEAAVRNRLLKIQKKFEKFLP